MLNGRLEEFKRSHGNALTPSLILQAKDVKLYVGTEQLLMSWKIVLKTKADGGRGNGILSRLPSIN